MWGEGTVLGGRYELRQRIGGGSMGDVWRAEDTVLGREVAVKILLPALLADAAFAARFRTEARVLAALSHPGIVSVFDYGQTDDPRTVFLVMELIAGRPLSELLDDAAPLSESTTMTVVAQTLEALQAAHDRGIVHRDVKPANLMLRGGAVVVTDFGVARTADARRLTAVDVVLGTAVYAAPEQARHSAVTAAADQYAVGVIAYECLTGAPPFDGDTPLGIMMKHLQEPVPPLPESISAPVRELVERALAKDPAERFGSAQEMAQVAWGLVTSGPGRVGRVGPPQDSFLVGAALAAEAPDPDADTEPEPEGQPASPPDPDWASFTVKPKEPESPAVSPPTPDEVEEGGPAWVSYMRSGPQDGPDWASFTLRPTEKEATAGEASAATTPLPAADGTGSSPEGTVSEPDNTGSPSTSTVPLPDAEDVAENAPSDSGLKGEPDALPATRTTRDDSFTVGAPPLERVAPASPLERAAPADPLEPKAARLRQRGNRTAIFSVAAAAAAVIVVAAVIYPLSQSQASASAAPTKTPSSMGPSTYHVAPSPSAAPPSPSASSSPTASQSPSLKPSATSSPSTGHLPATPSPSAPTRPANVPPSTAPATTTTTVAHQNEQIVNVGDGAAIDVFGNSSGAPQYSDGSALTVEPPTTRTGQSWLETTITTNGNSVYEFGDGLDTNQLLDDSASGNGVVSVWHCGCGATNQMWWLSTDSSTPSGSFYIHNDRFDGCLTDNGISQSISVKSCVVGNKAQQWYLP